MFDQVTNFWIIRSFCFNYCCHNLRYATLTSKLVSGRVSTLIVSSWIFSTVVCVCWLQSWMTCLLTVCSRCMMILCPRCLTSTHHGAQCDDVVSRRHLGLTVTVLPPSVVQGCQRRYRCTHSAADRRAWVAEERCKQWLYSRKMNQYWEAKITDCCGKTIKLWTNLNSVLRREVIRDRRWAQRWVFFEGVCF